MPEKSHFLTFKVIAQPEANGGIPKRFAGVAYSGGLVPGYGWNGDSAIDLSSVVLPEKPVFALVDHDHGQRAGQGRLSLDGQTIQFQGEFFSSTDAGKEVAALFAENAPWELSVGFTADAAGFEKPTAIELNGQTLTVTTVFKNARIREVSFVPAGADPNTRVTAFSRSTPSEATPVDETADLKAQVEALRTELAAEKEARASAETRIAEIQMAARRTEVTALFNEMGREDASDDALQHYLEMSAETFAAVAADLKALKPKADAPAHLFTEQATSGNAPGTVSLAALNAKLTAQVAGRH
jgi:phage head maturation protease